jgi:hypothetical protein
MDGQDGVAGIVLVEEQRPELGLLEVLLELPDAGLDIGVDALALGGEFGEDFELLLLADDLPEKLDVLLQQLFFLLQGLGGLLVLPDLGRGQPGGGRFELRRLVN